MYNHKQFGWVTFVGLLCGLLMCLYVYNTSAPFAGMGKWIALSVCILIAVCIPLFSWLTVTIDEKNIVVVFGIGLIRKKIPLSNIKEAVVVKNKWWYGWGIRYVFKSGLMYNVSGLHAVEVTFNTGKKFRIGTDEPEKLKEAIERKI